MRTMYYWTFEQQCPDTTRYLISFNGNDNGEEDAAAETDLTQTLCTVIHVAKIFIYILDANCVGRH